MISRPCVLLCAALAVVGCSDTPTDPAGDDSGGRVVQLPELIVSNAVGTGAALSSGGSQTVSYVSLSPGTLVTWQSVTIRNATVGTAPVAVAIIDGGFDPVPIPAVAGDRLELVLSGSGGSATAAVTVGTRRAPAIVRWFPHQDRRDVPLIVIPTAIFSEPVNSESVANGIQLFSGEGPVAGSVRFRAGEPWIAEFVPAAPLQERAAYELRITEQVRDLDDDALDAALSVAFTTAGVTSSSADERAGRLLFTSFDGAEHRIYTMKPDGTNLVNLGIGLDPDWSPDGTRIAFWRYTRGVPGSRPSSGSIYVMNADGSNIVRVTEGYQPTWAPDGQRLAFGCGGLCLVNVDGTGRALLALRELAQSGGDLCTEVTDPAWSPDGSTIAFTRWPPAFYTSFPDPIVDRCISYGVMRSFPFDFWPELWLVDATGAGLRALTDGEREGASGAALMFASYPAWSPDGSQIAFYHLNADGRGIKVINKDGTGLRSISTRAGWPEPTAWDDTFGGPAWSPDGSEIVVPELFPDPGFASRYRIVAADGSGTQTVVDAASHSFRWTVWRWSRR